MGNIIRIFIFVALAIPSLALAKTCKPRQGELALAFSEIRARLAVAAGQCMGFGSDVDAEQFKRFLARHKDWTLQGDLWVGEELQRTEQSKGQARSLGAHHYENLIHLELENSRARRQSDYCSDALVYFRQWIHRDSTSLQAGLKDAACLKDKLQFATTPSAIPSGN